jgi:hypothetical protein
LILPIKLSQAFARGKKREINVYELLESRILLSGTVTLKSAHGRLFITGDDQANQIVISEHNNLVDVGGLAGTTLVGAHKDIAGKFFRGIVVTLKGGNDLVTFSGHLFGDLNIDTGDGNDIIAVANASVSNDMLIKSGPGDDGVDVSNSSIRFIAEVEQDTGRDATVFSSVHVGTNLKINDLVGNAQMSLSRVFVGANTTINTGDTSDGVAIHHSRLNGSVKINTAGGNDSIILTDTHTNDSVSIDAGTGTNHVLRDVFVDTDFSKGLQGWQANAAGLSAAADGNVDVVVKSTSDETSFPAKVLKISSPAPATLYLTKDLTKADGIIAGQSYNVQFTVEYLSNLPTHATDQQELKVAASSHSIKRSLNPQTSTYQLNIDHGTGTSGGADATVAGVVSNNTAQATNWRTVTVKTVLNEVVRADSKGRLSLFVGTDPLVSGATSMRYVAITVKLTPATT